MSSNAVSNPTESTKAGQSLPQPSKVPSNLNAEDAKALNAQTNGTAKGADEEALTKLREMLAADSLKKQLKAIRSLATMGDDAEAILIEFVGDRMSARNPAEPTPAHGSAYQYLYSSSSTAAKALIEEFPDGLVCPQSDQNIDYSELQMLLVKKEYQAADKLTNQKLCELAGESAVERKWIYFTEVGRFPEIDLQAMDAVWQLYSEGKFGWSQQQAMWTRLGKDWGAPVDTASVEIG